MEISTGNQNFTYSDAKYWDDRWKVNAIGFHKKERNPLVLKYFL